MSSALSLEKIADDRLSRARRRPSPTRPPSAASAPACATSPQKTIADVFTEVSKNRADYGVVPVENSTEGVVTHTLDMFVDSDLKIVAQIVLPVQHCLLSNCAARRRSRSSTRIRSRSANAAAGCRTNLPRVEIIETSSNARSAELAAKEKEHRRHRRRAGRREIRRACARIRHPGQRRQRHALPRAGPPMQSAHRQRPHQPDVQHHATRSARCITRWRRSAATAST